MRAEKTANLFADIFRERVGIVGLDRVRLFGAGVCIAAIEKGTQITCRVAATPALIEDAEGAERVDLEKTERILPGFRHAGPRGEMKHMIDRAVRKLVAPEVKPIRQRQRKDAVPQRTESLHQTAADETARAGNDESAFAVRGPIASACCRVRLRHPLSFVRRIG